MVTPFVFRLNLSRLAYSPNNIHLRSIRTAKIINEGVVSKETVVLRRWGSSIQKFGFINGVDNVNWPPYRDSQLLESLYGGQFTLSTPLIKPNFCSKNNGLLC